MNFFFCIDNSTVLPLAYDPYSLRNPNCNFFYQPLALNHQLPNLANQTKISDIKTNYSETLSGTRVETEKKPKKREKNYQKQQVSAKKNGQSNIINSYFTYILSKHHSEQLLKKVAQTLSRSQADTQKIVVIIYNIIRLINLKRARRYINKAILYNYFAKETLQEMFGTIQALSIVSVDQLSVLLRKCFFYYLNHTSLTSILTSKRIPIHSKFIHMQKRRGMLAFVRQEQEKLS